MNGFNAFKASIVALAALRGDFEPNDLLKMFSIPASSRTERTAPPANGGCAVRFCEADKAEKKEEGQS